VYYNLLSISYDFDDRWVYHEDEVVLDRIVVDIIYIYIYIYTPVFGGVGGVAKMMTRGGCN